MTVKVWTGVTDPAWLKISSQTKGRSSLSFFNLLRREAEGEEGEMAL